MRWRVWSVGGPFVDTSQLDLDRLWVILVSGDSYRYSDFGLSPGGVVSPHSVPSIVERANADIELRKFRLGSG